MSIIRSIEPISIRMASGDDDAGAAPARRARLGQPFRRDRLLVAEVGGELQGRRSRSSVRP